jgi:hypothetical protein
VSGLTYLGHLGISAVVPGASAAIVVALPELQARLAGAAAAAAQLTITPPTFVASLAAATELVATLTAQGTLPSLSFQLTALASIVADLQASVDALIAIDGALGAAGSVDLYAYGGRADGLGAALPTSLPSGAPEDAINALVIAVSSPTVWANVGVILKVS